jgi:hypothetical protein
MMPKGSQQRSVLMQVHMMLEGFDFDCAGTMFDDIVIKRYTGSPEQAAAVNAAVHPAGILFSENFDGGEQTDSVATVRKPTML